MKKHLFNLKNPLPEKKYAMALKVLGVILFVFAINFSSVIASESLLSERIQLTVDNVTLKDALKEIEKQSEFTFLYNDASINVNQTVSVSAAELSIKDLLDKVLDDKGINYTIIDNQIVLTKAIKLQEEKVTVSGHITDSESSDGLPGVTIVEKGTSNGTITDLDGNYTLSVAADASIIVSYVGYVTEEIVVGGQTTIDLALIPDIISLEDVVVIGYGTIKKSDLTGAVASVSSEELSQSAVSGIDQALQGRTAGVTVTSNSGSPGSAPSVRIRGTGTVTNPDPLFIVDGVPVEASDVGALNPGDIESTEILKDASAAAIYGARAANGVVILTTKKGKAGTSTVNFDMYTGVQNLAKKYELTSAQEFISIRNKSGIYDWEDSSQVVNTDWQDEIFRKNALISNYQLSFSGGTEKTTYALMGSYYNQEGIVKTTGYERLTFRINSASEIKPWLKVGENVTYTSSKTDLVQEQNEHVSVVATSLTIDPATPVYDSNGVPSTSLRNNIKNPVGTLEYDDDQLKNNKLLGNLFIDIKPLDWLSFKTSFGASNTTVKEEAFFRDYNESTTYFRNQNMLVNASYDYRLLIWENTLSFSKTFAEKHDIQALVGYSRQSNIYRYSVAASNDIPDDPNLHFISNTSDPATIGYGDITQEVGGYNIWNPLNPYDNQLVPYDAYLISYLGRIMYNYNNLIDIHASVRRDGSSKFGSDTKWGIFPAFAGGLKISELGFLKDNEYVSFLKIRVGYGQLGNQEVGNYRSYTDVATSHNYATGPGEAQTTAPGGAPTSVGNDDLKWETTEMTNFGLDLNMFKNKLSLNADYFIRTTKDMLVEVPVPGYLGIRTAPLVNKGSIRNNGFELNLVFKNRTGDFNYEVSGNIAFIKNEVLELGSDDAAIQGGYYNRGGFFVSRTEVGEPIASFYGYVTDGYWQTQEEIDAANQNARDQSGDPDAVYDSDWTAPGDIKFKDLDGDGMVTNADQTFIGNPSPDITYGININLSYKIFDLSIFGQGVHGNEIVQSLIYFHEGSNAYWNMSPVMNDTWTPDNPNPSAPRFDQLSSNDNLRISDRYVKDGSYFRIRNLQIGVSLPKSICDQLKLQKLRVYFAAQNLVTFSKYTGFSPIVGTGNEVLDMGIDRGLYPEARSYMIGASLTF